MSKPQLIVCGSIALDRIMNFSGHYKDLVHPEKLHVLSLSVLLDKLEDTPGGVGANIAYNAAQLGDTPILFGSAGKDATDYLEQLAKTGVNTEFVHLSNLPTASFNVITDADDNQVGGFYPGAMSDSKMLSLEKWADDDALVIISAHDPEAMWSQTDECLRLGIRLVFDPGQQVSNVSGDVLAMGTLGAEVLIVNDYEFGVLATKTGETPESIKTKVPIVITTFGKDGSVIEGQKVKQPIKIPAATPTQVADPTGAGDGYRAGFLYGYLRQWELPICGQLGAVVASFIVEKHGTQVPFTKQAVMERYQKTFNERIEL